MELFVNGTAEWDLFKTIGFVPFTFFFIPCPMFIAPKAQPPANASIDVSHMWNQQCVSTMLPWSESTYCINQVGCREQDLGLNLHFHALWQQQLLDSLPLIKSSMSTVP